MLRFLNLIYKLNLNLQIYDLHLHPTINSSFVQQGLHIARWKSNIIEPDKKMSILLRLKMKESVDSFCSHYICKYDVAELQRGPEESALALQRSNRSKPPLIWDFRPVHGYFWSRRKFHFPLTLFDSVTGTHTHIHTYTRVGKGREGERILGQTVSRQKLRQNAVGDRDSRWESDCIEVESLRGLN